MLIDIHAHIGRIISNRKEFMDVANLIEKMDKWNIDIACVLPLSENPEGGYLECGTEDVISACSRHPARLFPFCLIDPRFGNQPEPDFEPLLEEYAGRGCRGLGELLPKMDFDDPRCFRLYRQAGKYNLPVLFDMTDGPCGYGLNDDYGLPKLESMLLKCPGTVFIGHGPTFWAEISSDVPADKRSLYPEGPVSAGGAVPRLMKKYPNLFADISAQSGYNALARDLSFGIEFLDEFQDKLMFGTDSCRRSDAFSANPNAALLQKLRAERKISPGARRKLEWENCARITGIKADRQGS